MIRKSFYASNTIRSELLMNQLAQPSWYAFGYILLTFVVGYLASTRGRGGITWTLISASISPIIAGAILMLLPQK